MGYADSVFTEEDRNYLSQAESIVHKLPDKIDGEWVRCHELARLVGELLGLEVADGRYGAMEHSWLILPSFRILDVYTPARIPQVQLADQWWGAPESYLEGFKREDIREDVLRILKSYL